MVDDQDPAESALGPYPEPIPPPQQQQQQHHQQQQQQQQHIPTSHHPLGPQAPGQNLPMGENQHPYPSMTQLLDPYDPMLDMDPFGLSASMQFPSSFSFDTSSMR
jgi:hypothetical protein